MRLLTSRTQNVAAFRPFRTQVRGTDDRAERGSFKPDVHLGQFLRLRYNCGHLVPLVISMSIQPSTPLAGSAESSPDGRLDSWKEIAAYLRREVRTVQRWEKSSGLPVHRLQVGKQGPVYAFRTELDAWYSDRRPELESDSTDQDARSSLFDIRRIRPWAVAAATVLIAMLSAGAYLARKSPFLRVRSVPAKIKLAVLPFKNLSADPQEEYFSNGMTEEMITELGGMQPERLGVIASTSAMRYENTQKDLRQICRELGVEYVLEGSVFRAGNRVRITAQLVQCRDQTHVWADSAERDLVNIMALQAEVAQNVARNIRIVLKPYERLSLLSARQVNLDAYEDYLKGMFFWEKFSVNSTQTAIKYFQSAIEKDPTYAPAYAGLANCYVPSTLLRDISPSEAYSRAKAAATKAIALDDNSAQAHFSLGDVADHYAADWSEAEREFHRAIELDPNFALAHLGYGYLLLALHKPNDAWIELRAGQALDPLSEATHEVIVVSLYLSRKYDEAIASAKQSLELYPASLGLHIYLGESYAQKGMDVPALAEYLRVEELLGASPSRISALRNAGHTSGLREFWLRKAELDEEPNSPGFSAYDVAIDHAALGDHEHSLIWLEKAAARHDFRILEISVEPRFDFLRSDARFQSLLGRIGLPQ